MLVAICNLSEGYVDMWRYVYMSNGGFTLVVWMSSVGLGRSDFCGGIRGGEGGSIWGMWTHPSSVRGYQISYDLPKGLVSSWSSALRVVLAALVRQAGVRLCAAHSGLGVAGFSLEGWYLQR